MTLAESPIMGPRESALLRRFCTGGDAEAFAELVQHYAGMVYSTCWRVLRDESDAADATQETFFELTRHANRVSGSLAGWLHKVATQKSIDVLRRCASRRRREETYARTQPVAVHSWQELSSHVDLALDELDEEARSLLLERFVLGKSAAQIARERGGSKATISRRINAGLTQLRGILRRRGLLVAAGALATMLTESASQVVSTTALHGLGKMAMVGTTEAATATAKAGLAKALVAAVVVGALSVGAYMRLGSSVSPAAFYTTHTNPISSAGGGTPPPGIDRMATVADHTQETEDTTPDEEQPGVEQAWAGESNPRPFGTLPDDRPSRTVVADSSIRPIDRPMPSRPPTPARTLHFPVEQSIGVVYVQDEDLVSPETVKGFHPGYAYAEMENFSCAQGEVRVPAGKRVILCIRGIGVTPQGYLTALGSLAPNDLYGLQFFSLQPVHLEDHLIRPIARLTGLRRLNLAGVGVSPRGLSFLASLKHLEQVSTPMGLTDEGMAEIARMSSLRTLRVARDRLTDRGLESLGKLTELESLELYGNPAMTDIGLKALTNLRSLRHLRLGAEGSFTDRSMAHLATLPSLKVLWLDAPNITDEGLRLLSESRSLERLCFHWLNRITGLGVEHLRGIPQLKALDIANAEFTEADLSAITAMPGLEHLELPGLGFTDAGIGRLTTTQHLNCLHVGYTSDSPLTDESLASLSQMRELEELSVGGTGFTNEGIALLENLIHLSTLNLAFWPGLDNDTLKLLARLQTLRELSWNASDRVTLSGLNALNDLIDLENLSAVDIRQDRGGLDLSRLKKLRTLRITMRRQPRRIGNEVLMASDMFYDSDLASLSALTELESLRLSGRGIGDEGLAHLAPLTRMKYLDIGGGAELTDEGLRHLSHMHRLDSLHIQQSRISERGLESLYGLKTIHILHISTTIPISPEAVARLRVELPHLQSLDFDRPESANLRAQRQAVFNNESRRRPESSTRTRW